MTPPPIDFEVVGMRDIVIETRADVKHIRDVIDKIQQCIAHHDERIRCLEISGSPALMKTTQKVEVLEERVDRLETGTESVKARVEGRDTLSEEHGHWINNLYVRAGIIAGIVVGVCGFIIQLVKLT